MIDEPFSTGDERDLLAAEHALGLLEGDEAARARDLALRDPDFAARVAWWNGRLAPLFGEIGEVQPPPHLLARIERAIAAGQPVAAANDNALRRKLARWRFGAVAMAAVAASLGVVLATRPVVIERPAPVEVTQAPSPPGAMVAKLVAAKGPIRMIATFEPATRKLVIAGTTDDLSVKAGRSHELWMIPAGGKPESMGVLPSGKAIVTVLTPAQAEAFRNAPTLAISDEPAGGSPTGQPTGEVLASGPLAQA